VRFSRAVMTSGSVTAGQGLERLVLSICVVLAAIAGCSGAPEEAAPARIGAGWSTARTSPGHRAHIERGIRCEDCHGVDGEELEMPTSDTCDSCHADVRLHHGSERTADACTSCHVFQGEMSKATTALDPAGLGVAGLELDAEPPEIFFREPTECLDCHDDAQGEHDAVVVHADQPCQDCHQPHGDQAMEAKSCVSCHQHVELHHGARSSGDRPIYEQCLDCHQPHGPAAGVGSACPTCHSKEEPRIPSTATFAGGHEACNGCHRSHDLRQAASSSCEGCHEGHQALGAARIKAHGTCTSCHDPHDVRQGAHDACSGCHQSAHTDHPAKHGALGACVTCHDPHPARAQNTAPLPCASCHAPMAKDHGHGKKDLACTECHQPHAFVKSALAPLLCGNCHQGEHTRAHQNPGHTACTGCHQGLPHHPETGSTDCARCHGAQQHATTKHEACMTCHEPHAGTQASPCTSCHKTEHASAPKGHQACTTCHDPHARNPRAVQKTCASCHAAEQAKNPHNALAAGCASCHLPHAGSPGKKAPPGPSKPPACVTCHKDQLLAGLHAERGHATCTSCHSPHDSAVRRDRESCTSCHQEQVNHQPTAKNCASCHLFRGGM